MAACSWSDGAGQDGHAAIPDTGIDALQGAVAILNALYAQNAKYKAISSQVRHQPPLPERRPHRGRHQHNVVPARWC